MCRIENDLPIMRADPQQQKSSRSWIFLMARWAAALLILGILFYLLPVAPLRNALSRVPLTRFIPVLLSCLVPRPGAPTNSHTLVHPPAAPLTFPPLPHSYPL